MPTEIIMPALSPTMEEGNLARWVKEVGDEIAPGDVIAEIETDKATMEVEAIDEGRLGKILVEAGTENVKVNTPIGLLLEEGEDESDLEKGASGSSGGSKGKDDKAGVDESADEQGESAQSSGTSVTPIEDRKLPAEGKKHPDPDDQGGHFQQEVPESTEMVPTTVREAIRDAMAEELRRDDAVFVMGEEVAEYEGAYKMTQGLLDEFGARRIVDTPITEHGFAGLGVGAAFGGLRPIVEFMTFNFAMQAMDQIINSAGKTLYMAGGKMGCPIVFRGPNGAAARVAAQHSQDYSAWYSHIPGLKVIAPYTAADAKGLLKAAVRDPNPVMFLENEILYGQTFDLPKVDDWTVPIGKARLHREGSDVTLVSFGIGMTYAVKAAEELAEQGIEAEIVDLRTLRPLDIDAVVHSVKKTNRCVTIEEGWPQNSVGGHIASELMVRAFDYLDAPVLKVTGRDVPMPYAANLEKLALPNVKEVVDAAKAVCYRD